ncbi:MAG: sigma 54-interacting transcriptional regulator [Pseudomonadota bacterium]
MATDAVLSWLLHDSPLLVCVIDDLNRFEQVSPALAARLGRRREVIIGETPDALCTAESRQRLQQDFRPMLRRTGRLMSVPIEFESADGVPIGLLVSSVRLRKDEAGHARTLSVFEDLRDVANSVRRFRNFYHLSPTMLHTMDPEGRLLDVSDQWLRRLGYGREDVIGRNVRHFLSDSTREQLEDGRLTLIADGLEFSNHPREMVARDGRTIEVLMSARAERDESGAVKRLYVASKDVTERNTNMRALQDALAENANLRRRLEHERDYLREKVNVSMNFGRIVGSSPILRQLLSRIEAVAQTNASVLIVGESGTGKELVAHAIHQAGHRAGQPLVKVNCASVPAELFESEFFGHVKGAFTGAHRDRIGRFALAHGGTIFLDEVGEIPLEHQGKLLRVLQEREFERVGDDETQTVDVRVVAATNRDLAADVRAGRFREDLFYRLSVFPVEVPPLRERGDDVIQIAAHLLDQIGRDLGKPQGHLSDAQVDRLRAYPWPGNVRELRNRLERAVILSQDGRLHLELPDDVAPSTVAARDLTQTPDPTTVLDESCMRAFERDNLVRALESTEWRVAGPAGAAALLGIKPTTLNGRMRKYNIERPRPVRGRPPLRSADKESQFGPLSGPSKSGSIS